jgi:hypothetical protein
VLGGWHLRRGLVVGLIVGLATAAPGSASAAVSFTTAPNAPELPSVTLNGQAQTKNATMASWGVAETLSQTGWNVTVQGDSSAGKSPVFKRYCPNVSCGSDPTGYVSGGATLAANSLKLNSTGASWTGGTGTRPTHSCNSGCNVDSATAVKAASASTSVGLTTWTTTGSSATSLALSVPTTIRNPAQTGEVYRVDLVWTLSTGP